MSKNILIPIDLNTADTTAIKPLGEAINMLDGGVLHMITVIPEFGMAQVSGFFRAGYEKDMLKAFGDKLTEWVNTHVPDNVEVRPHVVHGTVYDEILRAAEKLNVDLIVMSAHRPDLSDYLLGPNAARVVRHAKQSVYVVRN
ncbi:universal stress protein UspA [Marivivens niveibacter]|uniref:Universal stress protein UspA n=1 Tax=Marivivens niveibacter TaxID=1930667 RepID=A0A251WVN1_9RHOB|nr:universal stress protein [Marivivens niveibacter]OUD08539.1 universal stress protein UspA [Marivivens niveibacter]